MRKFLTILIALAFVFSCSLSFAGGRELTYEKFQNLTSLSTTPDDADEIPVFDNSGAEVKRVLFTKLPGGSAFDGDVTFRTSLVATGRNNAASTAASSSTNLAPANLPYSVLTKRVGGTGGLDETDGGTRLVNGTPGQILMLLVDEVNDGTWIVTPATATGFTTLTFNAILDSATLLYFDDTIGWVVLSTTSVTVA